MVEKIKNKTYLPIITSLIIGFIFLGLSLAPLFYEANLQKKLPPNRVMILGEPQYPYDYNVYLSKIRQGKEGRWTIIDKYTNQVNQKGVFLQMFYLLQGKAAKLLNLAPAPTYHLTNILTAFAWILTIITANIFFLKQKKYFLPGILLSFLASSFPLVFDMYGRFWIGHFMGWWQEMDVLKRISYIPHYNLNYIIITILTILLSLYGQKQLKKRQKTKYLTAIITLTFLGFFIHPSGSIVFLLSWFLYHALRLVLKTYSKKQLITVLIHSSILGAVNLIPLMYLQKVTTTYPWKSLVDYDQYFRLTVPIKDYLLSLGPVFITGALAIILLITKLLKTFKRQNNNNQNRKIRIKEKAAQEKLLKLLPLATWFIAAFSSLLGFKLFPYQSELRFVQTANHIPLAILSIFLLKEIMGLAKNSQQKIAAALSITTIYLVITVLGSLQVIYSLKSQFLFLSQKTQADFPKVAYPPQVTQPLKDFYLGLKYLEQKTNRNTVVLSQLTAGNYIPAYAGNFVYLGHVSETPNFTQREKQTTDFFQGRLNQLQAENFLKQENINYIFYGPQEKENTNFNLASYSFLKPVFHSQEVTIFQVLKNR